MSKRLLVTGFLFLATCSLQVSAKTEDFYSSCKDGICTGSLKATTQASKLGSKIFEIATDLKPESLVARKSYFNVYCKEHKVEPTKTTYINEDNNRIFKTVHYNDLFKTGEEKISGRTAKEIEKTYCPNNSVGFYMAKLQSKIKEQWQPPKLGIGNSYNLIAYFSVDKQGRVSDIKLEKPLEHSASNKAAIDAIKKAAPFGELPAELNRNRASIEFTFDYNVYYKDKKNKES